MIGIARREEDWNGLESRDDRRRIIPFSLASKQVACILYTASRTFLATQAVFNVDVPI